MLSTNVHMAQVCKNLYAGVRIVTAHSLHKYLGNSFFHGSYWSFQKECSSANLLVQVTSALTDISSESQIKLKD